MICAIDIGNTRVKVCLIDEKLNIIEHKNWNTPDLFEPDRWKYFFDVLNELNPLFFIADLRIACVSWRAFLALRVYLKLDSAENFNPHREFNPDYLIMPASSPVIVEGMIPLKSFASGLIGVDRLLAAYAVYTLFKKTSIVASLGTATTIDMVTNTGIFISGAIVPGVDASYSGLLSRANYLPDISELAEPESTASSNVLEALYTGVFTAQGILIDEISQKLTRDTNVTTCKDMILTGGRAYSVSRHIKSKHMVIDNLTAYGLALAPDWKNSDIKKDYSEKTIKKAAEKICAKNQK